MPRVQVALDDGDFDQVAREVHAVVLCPVDRDDLLLREQLVGNQPDSAAALALWRDEEILRRQRVHEEGVARGLPQVLAHARRVEGEHPPAVHDLPARAVHVAHGHGIQVVEHQHVRRVPRRNRAHAAQAEALRCPQRRHLYARHGRLARLHRAADDVVDVPLAEQVGGVAVVRHQQAALRIRLVKERQQLAQVTRRRALADHHPLPLADALARLLKGRALVVVAHACGDVAVERLAGEQRRVPVDDAPQPLRIGQLGHHLRVAREHAGVVHHLRQPQHARMDVHGPQLRRAQLRA